MLSHSSRSTQCRHLWRAVSRSALISTCSILRVLRKQHVVTLLDQWFQQPGQYHGDDNHVRAIALLMRALLTWYSHCGAIVEIHLVSIEQGRTVSSLRRLRTTVLTGARTDEVLRSCRVSIHPISLVKHIFGQSCTSGSSVLQSKP